MHPLAAFFICCAFVVNFMCCLGRPELRQQIQAYEKQTPASTGREVQVTEGPNRRRFHNENVSPSSSPSSQEVVNSRTHQVPKKTQGRTGDHPIVFPDAQSVNYIPKTSPKKCVGSICEDIDDYPTDFIKGVLSKTRQFDQFFNNEIFPGIADRLKPDSSESEEQSLCQTQQQISYPKAAMNTNNSSKFIVNVDGYRQGVVFETCITGATCQFSEIFPNDYITSCKQKYAIRRLMSISEGGEPALDSFEVPSCCVCTYKRRND